MTERLTEVLAEHQRRLDGPGSCRCGEWPPEAHDIPWNAHLAAVLEPVITEERARALEEAAEEIGEGHGISTFIGMDPLSAAVRAEKRAQDWLCDRAARERGAGS